MIEIRGIKVLVSDGTKKLEEKIIKKLHIKKLPQYIILKRSIDARKKPNVFYIYNIGVFLDDEEKIVQKINDNNVMLINKVEYQYPTTGNQRMKHHPLVIGSGPAGLFCALLLAKKGYSPIVIERGQDVDKRIHTVNSFFDGGPLNPESNVQFGEGGAGTFSDGKLNTQVKDKYGRIRYVLEEFVKHGAPNEILYDNKPHVGTDLLTQVVKGIRREIEDLGGVFLFETKAIDIQYEDEKITKVKLLHKGYETWVNTNHVILAIGHSARDTFYMLNERKVFMKQKNFAMGVRVEHPAKWIQDAMYGTGKNAKELPAAPYKLTYQTKEQRGVYSFCMCPGGYVVNASSEEECIAVNGMSYSGRNGINSNSAIVVQIKESDFKNNSPLAGIELQRQLEHNIFVQGKGKVITQRFEDFCNHLPSTSYGAVQPQIKGEYTLGNLAECLPDFMTNAIIEGIRSFENKIKNFSHKDTILSGVESRTSSPIKIERNIDFVSNIEGLYPCGEGAGYAGGIMSAAMDGMKVAEAIITKYAPINIEYIGENKK